ncbi:hypothetical protein FOC1_g10004961 [Fusarium oxysporum f. sp. cubense race 1]|uniref:Uncharacterized protein n=1 Tax=Fusarium oxysporum f. sp. cubense (strain race 1) TaxID=1229664 RepID=N4USS1_FUSC1|nr:hypothetical protein FOC1_g10004961 [Fusarium oxysporum f. sp. cubense race 1]
MPPTSSHKNRSVSEVHALYLHLISRKRRRSTHDQGPAGSDGVDGAVEDTPRASSRGLREGAPNLDRFVASTLQDGKSTTNHRLPLGSTYNAFDLYKLLMALQCLGLWIKEKYWPAFRRDVLKIPAVEQ